MGNNFMDSFCCINKDDIIYNQNYPRHFNYGNANEKKDLNKSLNPMERKSLPSNEIYLEKPNKKKFIQISTIGNMPLCSNNFILEKYGSPCKDYEMIEKLGEGTYGEVFLCKNKITNQKVAIKKILKKHGLDEKEVKQEIEILRQLNHPYILKLYEYYITEDYIYLVEELCSEGDLSEKLYKIHIFPEFIVKIIMMQIFKALMYLYSKKILHGDLKLENILIDSYHNNDDISESNDKKKNNNIDNFIKAIESDMVLVNKGLENKGSNIKFVLGRVDSITVINKKIYETTKVNNFKFNKNKDDKNNIKKNIHNVYNSGKLEILKYGIKLIDFGCSKIFNRTKRNFNDIVGTLVYCSPEVLSNNYDYSCDIWACGVIMYILLSGIYPFYGETEEEININIISGKFSFDSDKFNGISEEAKDLIKKCFILDPNKRISIIEALNHPFFDDLKDSKIFMEDEKKIFDKLKHRQVKPKFYQIVLTYMSYHFNDKEVLSELSRIFYKIDRDSDGKISKNDLYVAYNEVGEKISKEEMENIIKSVDFDKNGFIEYEEFIRVLIPEEKLFTEENLKNAFALFDTDKNGFITPTQIINVLEKDEIISEKAKLMLKDEIKKIIGNDIIEYEKFKNIMLTLSMQ